jgi:hypothetical protein
MQAESLQEYEPCQVVNESLGVSTKVETSLEEYEISIPASQKLLGDVGKSFSSSNNQACCCLNN